MTQMLLLSPVARFGRFGTALIVALVYAAAPASAQNIVFDNFDDGDVSDTFAFAGGATNTGAGTGATTGANGTAGGLELGVDPGSGGGFAGAGVPGPAGVTDISGQTYFSFYVRPTLAASNLPMTLEINFQEDVNGDGAFDPAVEDEFQAVFRLNGTASYQFVQIPIASFTDDNTAGVGLNDGFDFTKMLQVVYAMGNLQGPTFQLAFDELMFTQQAITLSGPFTVFDNFDDGDVSDTFAFAGGATNTGAGTGATTGANGTAGGLELGVDPGSGGGFAGAGVPGPAGVTDISGQTYFSFYVRPTLAASNLPMTLEINFQEDVNGDGAFDPAVEDEFQAVFRLNGTASYQFVQIPIASFTDDNTAGVGLNDGFDFTKMLQVVYAMGNLQGPTFQLAFDELGFTSGMPTSSASAPEIFSVAPVAYPNPTTGAATVAFELSTPSQVVIDVVDLLGRRVARLLNGTQAAGVVRAPVETGSLAPGVYLVRVQTDAGVASTRLSVTR